MPNSVAGVVFDTTEYLEAVQPPVFVHGGRRHTGRVLSWQEWVTLLPHLGVLRAGGVGYEAMTATLRAIVDELFPPPPPDAVVRRWWAPWRRIEIRRAPTAADDFLTLPFPVQMELLNDFLVAQGDAIGPSKNGSTASGSPPKPPSGPTSPTS